MKSQRFHIAMASLAFCLYLSMNAFVFWGASSILNASGVGAEALFVYHLADHSSFITGFILFALGATFYPRFFSRTHFLLSALLLSISFILLFVFFSNDYAFIVLGFSGVLIGMGSAVCFISWIRQFFLFGLRSTRIIVLFSSAVSSILCQVIALLPQTTMMYMLALPLIPISLVLFSLIRRESREEVESESKEILRRKSGLALGEASFFIACLVLSSLLSPVVASVSGGTAFPETTHMLLSLFANLTAAAVMFVLWFSIRRRIKSQDVFISLFPILAFAVLLLFILNTTFVMPFFFIGSTVFSMASMILIVFCIETSEETGANVTVVFTVLASIMYLSHDLSSFIGDLMGRAAVTLENQLVIIAFGLLYFLFFLVFVATRVRGKRKQRLTLLEAQHDKQVSGLDTLAPSQQRRRSSDRGEYDQNNDELSKRVAFVAERYRLTPRESQVLLLLAHGRDVPSTARILVLSENTIRTHTKGIYQSLNVHTRQELIDLVEAKELEN